VTGALTAQCVGVSKTAVCKLTAGRSSGFPLRVTGALTAQCVGVSKTAVCKLIQRDDVTFTLSVRPQETGRHMLTIKFNNEHVPGRHFTILVVTHTHTHTHPFNGPFFRDYPGGPVPER